MPVLLHQQPVLTLALDSFQDTTIDENDIRRMWILFTKCKDDIKNGFRLENISWRIWYKKYLNNTSDLFSNDKIYNNTINNSVVHSVDSSCTNFSLIEPIEVLKKCACGEQLISSSLNSLSTPHSEYTCFNKLSCQHHHQQKQKTTSLDTNTTEKLQKNESLNSSENTLVQPSIIPDNQIEANSEKIVEVLEKEEEPIQIDQNEDELNKVAEEIPQQELNNKNEVVEEEKEEEKEILTTTSTSINNNTIDTETNINMANSDNSNTTNQNNHTLANNNIPPNCPTLEQFYQQQLLLLQQMYIQKQQQLQYQKQQMNVNTEQIYKQQICLQQWFNQQQQQLLSNCAVYYKRYLQQFVQQAQTQVCQQTIPLKESTCPEDYEDDEEDDDDYDDDDDDEFYDDEEDDYEEEEDFEIKEKEKEKEKKEENEKIKTDDTIEKPQESKKDDLFKKVTTPILKNKITKPSLLSAMIKENNYNEYKKTVEKIQRYEDVRESNNIYSIMDYNHNCINSLNKNVRRKRAPSFEDVRNAQHGYRKLFEMHPLNNKVNEQKVVNSDIEEYYERNPHATCNGTNNSYSTVNTINSQDSHTTYYSNHNQNQNQNDVYGSNKTNHSTKSTRSTKSFLSNRTNNNNSINLYMNKKKLNYSN